MKELFAQIFARIFLLTMALVISATTMIYGWGVEPRSWPVIIGLGYFGLIAVQVCNKLLD